MSAPPRPERETLCKIEHSLGLHYGKAGLQQQAISRQELTLVALFDEMRVISREFWQYTWLKLVDRTDFVARVHELLRKHGPDLWPDDDTVVPPWQDRRECTNKITADYLYLTNWFRLWVADKVQVYRYGQLRDAKKTKRAVRTGRNAIPSPDSELEGAHSTKKRHRRRRTTLPSDAESDEESDQPRKCRRRSRATFARPPCARKTAESAPERARSLHFSPSSFTPATRSVASPDHTYQDESRPLASRQQSRLSSLAPQANRLNDAVYQDVVHSDYEPDSNYDTTDNIGAIGDGDDGDDGDDRDGDYEDGEYGAGNGNDSPVSLSAHEELRKPLLQDGRTPPASAASLSERELDLRRGTKQVFAADNIPEHSGLDSLDMHIEPERANQHVEPNRLGSRDASSSRKMSSALQVKSGSFSIEELFSKCGAMETELKHLKKEYDKAHPRHAALQREYAALIHDFNRALSIQQKSNRRVSEQMYDSVKNDTDCSRDLADNLQAVLTVLSPQVSLLIRSQTIHKYEAALEACDRKKEEYDQQGRNIEDLQREVAPLRDLIRKAWE